MKSIHAQVKVAYGSRRMHREPRQRPSHRPAPGRAADARERHQGATQAALQGDDGIPGTRCRWPTTCWRATSRLQRPTAWTGDITYIQTGEGWLYLAIVLDLFNREIVGWSIKPRMTADIVTDALTMAWFRRKPGAGVLFHSDRGSQYASQAMAAVSRIRHDSLDEPKGQLLGQCANRKLLQQPEERAGAWHDLRDAS